MSPQLHPRHAKVSELRHAISQAINEVEDTTLGETLAALADVMGSEASCLISIERFPERFPDLREEFAEAVRKIDQRDEEDDD